MKRMILGLAVGSALGTAMANPTGPTVASGAALISNPSASVMQIVNTPGTILNWQGFSIAGGETTRFVQLNAASAILNRVVGANPSDILGRLESNGRVFLINPNGIVFGGGAVVDVAGLIASTRDISNADFLAGNYLFSGASNGAITMQNGAQILTSTYGPGGQVWLFAKNITQEAGSTITAPQGQVVLAAGSQLQVATNGLGQMSFAVTTDGANTVDSLGTIAADRGAVGLFADFVNHRGTINAANGTVNLHGGAKVEVTDAAVINADGTNGKITFRSNDISVAPSGRVHAVNGEVVFDQYAPTQWTVETLPFVSPYYDSLPLYDDPADLNRMTWAVTAPQANGNFLVRYFTWHFGRENIYEVLFDSNGNAISAPSLIANFGSPDSAQSYNDLAAVLTAGFGTYYGGIGSGTRLFTGTGGAVQDLPIVASVGAFALSTGSNPLLTTNFFGSNGALLRQVPHNGSDPVMGGSLPLRDGTIARWDFNSSSGLVEIFKADGTLISTRDSILSPCCGALIQYLTPTGMIFIADRNRTISLTIERWTKNVPSYTPGASIGGPVGVAANFASRANLPQDRSVAPPPAPPAPPPIVFGSGSGASFGGVLGCNSAVCSEIERLSIAIIDSMRVAGNTTNPPSAPGPSPTPPVQRIDGEAAKRAVSALDSTMRIPNPGEPLQIPYPGQPMSVYDNGSLARLKALGLHDASEADQVAGIMAWRDRERVRSSGDEAGAVHAIAIPHLMNQLDTSGLRDIVRNPRLRQLLLNASAGPSL